jgi:hypothetical protein
MKLHSSITTQTSFFKSYELITKNHLWFEILAIDYFEILKSTSTFFAEIYLSWVYIENWDFSIFKHYSKFQKPIFISNGFCFRKQMLWYK